MDDIAKRRKWLFDMSRPVGDMEQIFENHAARLRPIVSGEKILGMAALSTASGLKSEHFGSVRAVGGLSTHINKSDLSKFVGVMDYEPATAKRESSGIMSAGRAALEAWATEQKSLLPDREMYPIDWCIATCSLADLGIDPMDVFTILILDKDKYKIANLDVTLDIISKRGLAFYESHMMRHVETHHDRGCFGDMPTFWPIKHSAFLSLDRDEDQTPTRTSILSCIYRRAQERKIDIVESYAAERVRSYFGLMSVLTLRALPST
jgi:hypothetical protein